MPLTASAPLRTTTLCHLCFWGLQYTSACVFLLKYITGNDVVHTRWRVSASGSANTVFFMRQRSDLQSFVLPDESRWHSGFNAPLCLWRARVARLTVWLIQLSGISGLPRSRRTLSFMLSTHGFSLRFPNGGSYSFTSERKQRETMSLWRRQAGKTVRWETTALWKTSVRAARRKWCSEEWH